MPTRSIWTTTIGHPSQQLAQVTPRKEGYYETATTPGLWRQKWRPIMFCLIVDDFGVEYVGKQHADHLDMVLKKYHNITEYWTGKNMQE